MNNKFAPINPNLSYWQKQVKPLFADLAWNIPEQKTGSIAVIGGNSQSFSNVIRTSEFLQRTFPIKQVTAVLPDALRSKIPVVENIAFVGSTASGSIAKSYDLEQHLENSDAAILAGDLSKNAETAIALAQLLPLSTHPLFLTRDSIDLLASASTQLLNHPQLFLIGSMLQLQKIFRSVYYPRMILLSQPLLPVLETLHKFTLTYTSTTIVTLHQDNVIVAHSGNISTTHLLGTDYSPISIWSGQLTAKIAALNLFNPHKSFEATTAALLYK